MNKFYLAFSLVGTVTYILWGWIVESVVPDINVDSLAHRLLVVGPIFVAIVVNHYIKKIQIEYLTYVGIFIITADYCYLISINQNLVHTTGMYVVLTASLSVIIKRWMLWAYAGSFLVFSLIEIMRSNTLVSQVHWANMITLIALMTFFGIWRIKYLDQLNAEFTSNLEKSKKLEQLNNIATQAAHDIRSPVMALESLASSLELSDLNKVRVIKESTRRVNEIADYLVQEYRKKFSMQLEDKTIFDQQSVSDFIGNLVDEKVASQSKFRQCEIRTHGKINFMITDPKLQFDLKCAISNMINNSIESFTDSNGKIDLILSEDKESFFVGVKDNGSGIPSSLHEKIFEKGATFNKQTGTGLGLSQVKQTIEKFGGKIELSSKEGVGTLIQLTLPKI